jgi:hypothetical protein
MSGIHMALLGSAGDPATISITNQNVADFTGGARTATAGYRLTSAGIAQTLVNATYTTVETWCVPTSEAVNYEVFVTVSGNLDFGPTGSWTSLSTTQTWYNQASVGNSSIGTLTVEIRRTGTTTVLDTATISLEADATF